LAAWDLFLDPQMVDQGYWRWDHPDPGLAGIPLTNYLGWLVVAVAMMALLALAAPGCDPPRDAPMYGLYLWTYYSSTLAHAVFLGLPTSAVAGMLGMGLVAVPLTVTLGRTSRRVPVR
jgi:putative membrane protein